MDSDIQGWMRPEELGWLHDRARQMTSVVEVGVWKGRTTSVLLKVCPLVYAVDTWETVIHGLDPEEARQEFVKNCGEAHNLRILQQSSVAAAEIFHDRGVDMVFIDADHSYEAVQADIAAWLPKARRLICGHDFKKTWPGVQRAVRERFGGRIGLCKGIWYHEIGGRP